MSTLTSLVFANTSENMIKLILEPWAEEYDLNSGMKVEIVATNSNEKSIEIEFEGENVIVYGWADSIDVLFEGEKLAPSFE